AGVGAKGFFQKILVALLAVGLPHEIPPEPIQQYAPVVDGAAADVFFFQEQVVKKPLPLVVHGPVVVQAHRSAGTNGDGQLAAAGNPGAQVGQASVGAPDDE